MDTHTAIAVSGLHRSYGGHQPDALSLFVNPLKAMPRFRPTPYEAVRGIDLEVRTGELFALLGTNGAGKTSALEVIEGLAPASAGTVEVLGQDPYADARTVRPRTGVMLQEAGFPNGLTAEETATMWAGTLTTPRPVSEALAMVGLTGRRAVATKSLSGGERRRLDLALAILGRPEVLFLDEPTTGLDPESRHAAWELISSLLAEGTTVMLTTHYLEEAERLADRIAIMHAGRIVTRGTLDEIVADQPSRIEFTAPALTDHHAPATLPDLPGAAVTVRGDDVRISTPTLQRTLHQLLQWADDGIDLVGLDARAASLEQAFLAVAQDSASPSSASSSTVSPTFITEEISA